MRRDGFIRRRSHGRPVMASAIAPPASVAGWLGSRVAGELLASSAASDPDGSGRPDRPVRARGGAGRPIQRGEAKAPGPGRPEPDRRLPSRTRRGQRPPSSPIATRNGLDNGAAPGQSFSRCQKCGAVGCSTLGMQQPERLANGARWPTMRRCSADSDMR